MILQMNVSAPVWVSTKYNSYKILVHVFSASCSKKGRLRKPMRNLDSDVRRNSNIEFSPNSVNLKTKVFEDKIDQRKKNPFVNTRINYVK